MSNPNLDRRTFVRRVGALALAPQALSLAACEASDRAPRTDGASEPGRLPRLRLLPWSSDAVLLTVPLDAPPMAYASRRERRIWVDRDHRDHVYWVLRAHISTSTGLWRIPLPSDPPRTWVQPDDEEREFAEYEIADFDPGIEPSEGDFRVVAGRPVRMRVELSCEPVDGEDGWLRSAPLELVRCEPGGEEGCREDLVRLAEGRRYRTSGCSGPGEAVSLWGWSALGGAR